MEFYENSQSPERALLIGVDTGEYNAEISMEELALLCRTEKKSAVTKAINSPM